MVHKYSKTDGQGARPTRPRADSLEEKVAAERGGRPRPLDVDLRPGYPDAPAKVDRGEAIAPSRQGDLKEAFIRPRAARPVTLVQELHLDPMLPRSVRGEAVDPRLDVDLREFTRHAGTVNADSSEGYVRIRVRIDGDSLAVLDSHLVEGPLREGASFPGGYAYDVTVGDRLLHAGPAPDLGVRRSFVEPKAPPGERIHHLTQVPTTILTVRVPAAALTREVLSEVQVRLYRLKGAVVSQRATREPLTERFAQEVREVASRRGLPTSVLPEELRKQGRLTGQG